MARSASLNQSPTSNLLIYHIWPTAGTQRKIHRHPHQPISSRPIKPQKKHPLHHYNSYATSFLFMHLDGIAIEIERNKQNVVVEEDVCRTQAGK